MPWGHLEEPKRRFPYFGIWEFPKFRGTVGVPYNKGYSILESILGTPYLGKLPLRDYHEALLWKTPCGPCGLCQVSRASHELEFT